MSAGKKMTASFGMEAELFNQTIGREWGGYSYHTYNHNDCSCPRDLLAASSSQIINCPEGIYEEFDASLKPDYTIGIDVKAYYGVGFTYCLEFEVDYFIEQVIAIFSE